MGNDEKTAEDAAKRGAVGSRCRLHGRVKTGAQVLIRVHLGRGSRGSPLRCTRFGPIVTDDKHASQHERGIEDDDCIDESLHDARARANGGPSRNSQKMTESYELFAVARLKVRHVCLME
jgi:hypothetical protein